MRYVLRNAGVLRLSSSLFVLFALSVGATACRLGANNSEKLSALKSGEIYDEDGVLSASIDSPSEGTLINVATDSTAYAASGTCTKEGSSIQLLIGDSEVTGASTTCSQGAWSLTFDSTSLASGEHSLSIRTSQGDGKTKTSSAVTIRKDTSVPQLAITSPSNASFINASSDSATFALSGTCTESGPTVGVLVDGASATAQNGGSCNGTTWAATISTLGLSAGTHTLKVTMTNGAGNTSQSSAIIVTRDITSPTAAITSPAASSYVNLGNNSASFAVSGTCNDSSANVQIKVDGSNSGSAVSCNGTAWNTTINSTGLSQGAHTLSGTISDPAGNSATLANVAVTKDTSAPTIALSAPANNSYVNAATDSASFAVSGTCSGTSDNGRSITVKINGAGASQSAITCGAGSTWSGTINTTTLADATYTVTAELSDAAGNLGSTASGNVVIKDEGIPTVSVTQPATGGYIQAHNSRSTFKVGGACSENTRSVAVKVNGTSATGQSGGTCTSSAWSATIDVTGLSASSVTISATHDDAAGNSGSSSSNPVLTRDLTKPGVPVFTRASTASSEPFAYAAAASGVARYVTVSSATGVLLEETSTNAVRNSETIHSTAPEWSVGSVTITSGQTAPDGATTAFKIDATAADSYVCTNTTSQTAGSPWMFSVWLKADTPTTLAIWIFDGGGYNNQGNITVGTTWQRYTAYTTATRNSTSIVQGCIGKLSTFSTGETVYAWHPQLESKLGFATSYIPTTSTATARAVDTMTIPTTGFLNPSEGAVIVRAYVDGDLGNNSLSTHYLFTHRTAGGTNNAMIITKPSGGNSWRAVVSDSSGTETLMSWPQNLSTGWHTFGLKWSATKVGLWIDGAVRDSKTTSINLPSALNTHAWIGNSLEGTSGWGQPIDFVATYLTAPSDTEMDTYTGTAGPSGEDAKFDFDGLAFSRASVAENSVSGIQAASGIPRYATISGSTGVIVEEGVTNLFSSSVTSFSGWSDYLGSTKTITSGQSDPFGGTNAYRIVSTGGTSPIKAYTSYGLGTTGEAYSGQVWVKNNSATAITVQSNVSGRTVTVSQADGWKLVKLENVISDGTNSIQMRFHTASAGDNLDVTVMSPMYEQRPYATTYHVGGGTRSTEILSIPSSNVLTAASGKIRGRFLLLRAPGTKMQMLVDMAGTGASGHTLFVNTSGNIVLQTGNGTALSSALSTTVVTTNTWYTFEGIWTASGIELKVNGSSEGTASLTPSISFQTNTYIGYMYGDSTRSANAVFDWLEFEKSDGTVKRFDFSNSLGQ